MGTPENLKSIQDELKWISLREESSLRERIKSKGIFSLLVPVGCLVTAGILGRGLYHFYKANSRKQQRFMRYRVAAQGVTVALVMFSIFQLSHSNKSQDVW